MERSVEELGGIIGGLAICPPKLEDAGLEDCALPPESIMEAFSRAATSLKSRIIASSDDDGDCVQDPGPTNGEIADALVGISGGGAAACGAGFAAGKGEAAAGGDDVVVVGAGDGESASDRVLVLGGEEGRGEKSCCPPEIVGDVGKGEVFDGDDDGDGDVEGDEDKRPILVEALI